MMYVVLARSVGFLLDLTATLRRSDQEKDLEILLLRQQLRILQRNHPHLGFRAGRSVRWPSSRPR